MHKLGIAKTVEAGVIAKYILGSPDADAYAAGCAFSTDFITKRPDVAKRFAQAWSKAIDYIRANPDAARKYLAKNTHDARQRRRYRADARLYHDQGYERRSSSTICSNSPISASRSASCRKRST